MANVEDFANTVGSVSSELARRIDQLFAEQNIDLHAKEMLGGIVEAMGSIEADLRKLDDFHRLEIERLKGLVEDAFHEGWVARRNAYSEPKRGPANPLVAWEKSDSRMGLSGSH